VHSNLGGGYPDDGLSSVALRWIVAESRKNGVVYKAGTTEQFTVDLVLFGKLYDSRAGLGAYYRYLPRRLDPPADAQGARIPDPKFHESVIWRIAAGTDAYAPLNLPRNPRVVVDDRAVNDSPNSMDRNIYRLAEYQAFIEGEHKNSQSPLADGDLKGRIAAKLPAIENPSQDALDLVWDTVWWRRISYFATVGATVLLIISPVLPRLPVGIILEPAIPLLEKLVTAVSTVLEPVLLAAIDGSHSVLPSFLSYWLEFYRSDPWRVIRLALTLATLLIWGAAVDRRIQDRALAAWNVEWRANRAIWLRRSAVFRIVAPRERRNINHLGGIPKTTFRRDQTSTKD
jgi:hypothetical protein